MTQDENLRDSVDSTEAATSPAEEARRRKTSHARSGEAEMPPTRRAGFHPLAREPKSTVQIGDVRYYDGAELSRPLEMPPRVKAIMLAAMVVAAVVGCIFLGRYFDQIMNEPIRQQQTLHPVVVGPLHPPLRAAAALRPALPGLLRCQRAEGAVQMEVRRVQYPHHVRPPPAASPCTRPPTGRSSCRSSAPAHRRSARWRWRRCPRRGTRCRTASGTRPDTS